MDRTAERMESSMAGTLTRDLRPPYRLPLLALGFLCLLLGLAAGVARLGWRLYKILKLIKKNGNNLPQKRNKKPISKNKK